jgi:O-antigen ligase
MDSKPSRSALPHRAAWLSDARNAPLLGAMMAVLIVLMIVPDGFDYGSLVTTGAPSSGGALSRALWLGVLAFAVLVVLWRARLAWLLVRSINPFLLIFVALAIASAAWSIDPSLTLRRLVRLATIVTASAAFVLMGWHARRFQNVVRPVLTAMLVGSIAFGIAFPLLAIHQQTAAELSGAWRGLANHKNGLGDLACLGLIFWLHAWLTREVRFAWALAGGGVAAACLLLSRSSTSEAALVVASAFLLIALRSPRALRGYLPQLVIVLVAALLVYALAILDLVPGLQALMIPIMTLTGKDITFTGRTVIWAILSDHIQLHPLLGTGYAAYWTAAPVPGSDSYAFIWRMASFYPGSAHNGYLDVLNDLGAAGLVCLLAYLVVQVRQCLHLLTIDRNQAILYLALFFQQAVTNLSETHWFSVLSVDFVLMTLATMALARGLLQRQLRAVFGEPVPVPGLRIDRAGSRSCASAWIGRAPAGPTPDEP